MATLGDAFSDDERRKSVARQLQPGVIIYLEVAFPQGRRPKYLVVAHVERECCTFVVNSQIHPFIEAHPALAVCQVKIDTVRQPYLRRDSYIACHQVSAPADRECDQRTGGRSEPDQRQSAR